MTQEQIQVLVLDDESSIRWVIEKTLSGSGYGLHFAGDAEEATRLLTRQHVDFALVDINLPGDDGFTFIQKQKELNPDLLVAVITGVGTMNNAVTAMKLGAFDYLTKPFDIDEIEALVERAAQALQASRKQHTPKPIPSKGEDQPDLIIGKSRVIREIYKSVGRVADTDINVLIQGESGTGKELVARAIHQHSPRAGRPFIALNCAAIPRELLESELFGYEKGAFTGATERRIGRMEAARGGTVFLDEIGDMPLDLQAKLLRVLQERELQRLGGLETIRLEARILAATNQSLLDRVESGGFRADLYYRLGAFIVDVVPLRERPEDIPLLVAHFLRQGAEHFGGTEHSISSEAMAILMAYSWPGNVRELENVVKSLMIMTRTNLIDVPDLPRNITGKAEPSDNKERFEQSVLHHWGVEIQRVCNKGEGDLLRSISAHLERPLLKQVLQLTRWNQVRASAILGINRNTLRTKMAALGLQKPGSRNGNHPDS